MPKTYTPPQAFETTPRPPIALVRVKSQQVAAIGYSPELRTLAVQFKAKAGDPPVYHYENVTPEQHAAFIGAESIGTFFGANIKPMIFRKYPAESLPE
jgi:hypothetical protein